MPDRCTFCEMTRVPTNHLVLNGGKMWIEFCQFCGENEIIRNEKGEVYTVREVFDKIENVVRTPEREVKIARLVKAEQWRIAERQRREREQKEQEKYRRELELAARNPWAVSR